jgi:hypothetical protein
MLFLSYSISGALPHLSEKTNINSGDLSSGFAACNYLLPKKERFHLKESFNVIPAKAVIQLSAFTFRMALKRFTSCPASAGMTDRFLFIDQFRFI